MNGNGQRVKHALRKGKDGEIVAEAVSGYHLKEVADQFGKWLDELRAECEETWNRYFGPGTKHAEMSQKLKEISDKPRDEQTDEDRAFVEEFLHMQSETLGAYGQEAYIVSSVLDAGDGREIPVVSGDLKGMAEQTRSGLMTRADIAKAINDAVFDIMRKSNLKMAAIALGFGESQDPKEKNNAGMMFASAFQEIGPTDIAVLDGRLRLMADVTLPQMAKNLGIVAAGPSGIIVPGK